MKTARLLPVFILFFATTVALQWRGGAFRSEFSGEGDEPAHYVTGLMVRDYLAAGMPGPAMPYAENYYLHYPKVGLGHWPPVFYVVQSAWTLVFSPSRVSVLLLMAALAALLATTLHEVVRRDFSVWAGIGAGLLMLSLPVVQQFSRMVMGETLLALLVFWAVLAYARYLDTEKWQDAAWFGLWASLAILTRGTGIVLALVPPLGVLLTRRFRLLARFSFWLPALMVLALCGPWYLRVPGARHEAVAPYGALHFATWRLWLTPRVWVEMMGIVPALLVAIGLLVVAIRLWRQGSVSGKWAVVGALPVSVFFFRAEMLAWEDRHLVESLPVLLMFLPEGVSWLLRTGPWSKLSARGKTVLVALPLAALVAVNVYQAPQKPYHGFTEVARDVLARAEFKDSVLMVSSDWLGDGMLVSEVAMREKRPGHIVLRAGKILARISFMGNSYRLLYHTPEQVMRVLEEIPVGILVMDLAPQRQYAHYRLLRETLETYRDRWELLGAYPRGPGAAAPNRIEVYRLKGHEGRPPGKIRINMDYTLGRSIENQ